MSSDAQKIKNLKQSQKDLKARNKQLRDDLKTQKKNLDVERKKPKKEIPLDPYVKEVVRQDVDDFRWCIKKPTVTFNNAFKSGDYVFHEGMTNIIQQYKLKKRKILDLRSKLDKFQGWLGYEFEKGKTQSEMGLDFEKLLAPDEEIGGKKKSEVIEDIELTRENVEEERKNKNYNAAKGYSDDIKTYRDNIFKAYIAKIEKKREGNEEIYKGIQYKNEDLVKSIKEIGEHFDDVGKDFWKDDGSLKMDGGYPLFYKFLKELVVFIKYLKMLVKDIKPEELAHAKTTTYKRVIKFKRLIFPDLEITKWKDGEAKTNEYWPHMGNYRNTQPDDSIYPRSSQIKTTHLKMPETKPEFYEFKKINEIFTNDNIKKDFEERYKILRKGSEPGGEGLIEVLEKQREEVKKKLKEKRESYEDEFDDETHIDLNDNINIKYTNKKTGIINQKKRNLNRIEQRLKILEENYKNVDHEKLNPESTEIKCSKFIEYLTFIYQIEFKKGTISALYSEYIKYTLDKIDDFRYYANNEKLPDGNALKQKMLEPFNTLIYLTKGLIEKNPGDFEKFLTFLSGFKVNKKLTKLYKFIYNYKPKDIKLVPEIPIYKGVPNNTFHTILQNYTTYNPSNRDVIKLVKDEVIFENFLEKVYKEINDEEDEDKETLIVCLDVFIRPLRVFIEYLGMKIQVQAVVETKIPLLSSDIPLIKSKDVSSIDGLEQKIFNENRLVIPFEKEEIGEEDIPLVEADVVEHKIEAADVSQIQTSDVVQIEEKDVKEEPEIETLNDFNNEKLTSEDDLTLNDVPIIEDVPKNLTLDDLAESEDVFDEFQ